jgi:metal-responsive CopG/Arc/MetJ family transcriptional regulator
MATTKVAITIESELLAEIDQLVAQHMYPNRSKAIQEALRDTLERVKRNRLARECAHLDPEFEEAIAEEGMEWELAEWPAY